jgi:hypothetical protein
MKPTFVLGMCLGVSVTLAAQGNRPGSARIVEGYGKLPLAFEANQGQTDPQVKFLSRGAGYNLFLTSNEAVLALHEASRQEPPLPGAKAPASRSETLRQGKSAVLRMKLVESNAKTEVTGQEELAGKSNYFIGNDPKNWHRNVRQFAQVRYENVYPGVDLVYHGHQGDLEYDFVLQPKASPRAIRLKIEGAKRLRLEHGDLVITSEAGNLHLRSPHIYQDTTGLRREVRGRFVINSQDEVGFEIAAYDRRRVLVIDPVLAYSTFLGGSSGGIGYDLAKAIAVDKAGNAYLTGQTRSADFPIKNAVQATLGGSTDAFVTKINADGSALVYSTYLGGHDFDQGNGIALDSAGSAYVTGVTFSNDFPTANAIEPKDPGSPSNFVTKMSADGSALIYSTYLGGGAAGGIAVDSVGNAYVTGETNDPDFPTKNAFQTTCGCGAYIHDAFVTKIGADGTALIYSTYLGGSGDDHGRGIAVDASGHAYINGWTTSSDFVTKNPIQATLSGPSDAFVTKIGAAGALLYSTYLGGSDLDYGWGVAVDTAGNAYLTGLTESTDFPLANPFQLSGGSFVTKINPQGSALVYSSYLGLGYQGIGIALDASDQAYVTGNGAFVAKINAQGSGLVYSTYLGSGNDGYGIAVDSAESAYVSGVTHGDFPTTPAGFQPLLKRAKNGEAFIAKIAPQTFVSTSTPRLTFPVTLVGNTSLSKQVTVTNQGASTMPINQIFVGGVNPSDFVVTGSTCGSTLGAGLDCTVTVAFTPMAKNARQAGLGISTPDPGSPNAVALRGTGTVVLLSKKTLAFGDQQTETLSTPQNVTLTNIGSTQLNFKGISISGKDPADFLETNTCGTSIAARANCTITVTFKPTTTGLRTGSVTVYDNGGGSPQRVAISGTGT